MGVNQVANYRRKNVKPRLRIATAGTNGKSAGRLQTLILDQRVELACAAQAIKVSADMKKPGKSDPSRPREDGYDYKREFYRSSQVAEDYDFHRFSTPERQKRNARKWAAIRKALSATTGVRTILDLPCGTGRFTGALAREGYEIVGSDISLEMLQKAASLEVGRMADGQPAIRGYVQANAEHLPLRTDTSTAWCASVS